MTRAATPENEEVLLDTARYGTASDLERQVRYYRKYKRIEKLEQDNVRFAQRKVYLYQDDDDSWVIRGRLTAVPELDEGPMDHDLGVLVLIQRE